MALVRCDFFSDVLELSTSMTVILPQQTSGQIGMPGSAGSGDPPVLYLLHGFSDDDTTWLRRTSIERYVAPLGLTVVMPQAGHSFYADEVHGNRYWTFLSEELPSLVRQFFRVSDRRADTFVAGLSMGGYGALKWALRHPEQFSAAASLSGVLDIGRRSQVDNPDERKLITTIFGVSALEGTSDDVLWLLDRADRGGPFPELYLCCGMDDALYADNVRFRDAARARDVPVTADFGPGEHDWAYWDAKIQDVLAWLPLQRPAG
jgi:putative tributyrin esterase